MSLDDPETVDSVRTLRDGSAVVLTIEDDRDWADGPAHAAALRAKVGAYLELARSGRLAGEHPGAAGRRVVIDVVARWPLPEAGSEIIREASSEAGRSGVEVVHRVVGEAGPFQPPMVVPAQPPELLPGRSAFDEDGRDLRARALGVGLLALVLAAATLPAEPRVVAIGVLAIPLFGAIRAQTGAQSAARRARRRERQAGYTTEFGRGGADLWQLDPRTGTVLRRPGEPLIDRAQARWIRGRR